MKSLIAGVCSLWDVFRNSGRDCWKNFEIFARNIRPVRIWNFFGVRILGKVKNFAQTVTLTDRIIIIRRRRLKIPNNPWHLSWKLPHKNNIFYKMLIWFSLYPFSVIKTMKKLKSSTKFMNWPPIKYERTFSI